MSSTYHLCLQPRGLFYEDYFDIADIKLKHIDIIQKLNFNTINVNKEKHLKWISLYKNLIFILSFNEQNEESASYTESFAFKIMINIRNSINNIDDINEKMRAKLSFYQHFFIIYSELYNDMPHTPCMSEIYFKNKHIYEKMNFDVEKNFCEKYCLLCNINKEE
jgi:hypothetical protein